MNNSEAEDKLKELFELSRLYDLYGELLNDHSRQIFEDYVLNNYSLSEIADETGLTRQGVRDMVVRCSAKLKEYEKKLGMFEKINKLEDVLSRMDSTEGKVGNVSELTDEARRIFDI